MRLFQYIKRELILTDLGAKSKAGVFRRMTRAFKDSQLIQDERELLRTIMAREKVMTTAIGKGLAVPHGFSHEVEDLVIAVATLSEGLDFQSLDERPVRVVFMIVANARRTDLNLKALAGISRMASHTPLLERLPLARGPDDVLAIIQESERQIAHH